MLLLGLVQGVGNCLPSVDAQAFEKPAGLRL